MTRSPWIFAWQLRRRLLASGERRSPYRRSTSPEGERWSALDVMACFANSPSTQMIWQRPQIPRPPQTESISTPRLRAASSTAVPRANVPRLPDGVNTSLASFVPNRTPFLRRNDGGGVHRGHALHRPCHRLMARGTSGSSWNSSGLCPSSRQRRAPLA